MADKQKILIVDDDEHIAELISLYLIKECYETRIAPDGESALSEFDGFASKSGVTSSPKTLTAPQIISAIQKSHRNVAVKENRERVPFLFLVCHVSSQNLHFILERGI